MHFIHGKQHTAGRSVYIVCTQYKTISEPTQSKNNIINGNIQRWHCIFLQYEQFSL